MTDEELNAIEIVKDFISWNNKKYPPKTECEALETVINLIEKQTKEIEKLKKHLSFYEKNESYKVRIIDFKNEIEELKSDLKYVLEQTLGAFEHNWCIDWNFTEIREKYGLQEGEE